MVKGHTTCTLFGQLLQNQELLRGVLHDGKTVCQLWPSLESTNEV